MSTHDGEDPDGVQRLTTPKMMGAAVAFFGGVVILSWYLYSLELVTVPTAWVPMQYNTAVGFVLTGLAVVAHCVGRRRTALVCGALAAGLGSVALAEQVLGRQFEVVSLLMGRATASGGRPLMAANTAVCFSLAGGLVLVASSRGTTRVWRRAAVGFMASLMAAAGFVGLISYVLNNDMTQGWARFTEMDVHTGLSFVGLGVAFFGILGRFRADADKRPLPPWAAWAAGGGVFALVFGIWVGLTSSEERLRVMATTRTHEAALTHANQLMQSHLRTLGRLTYRLGQDQGAEPGEIARTRERDVDAFVEGMAGFVGLVQLDGQGEPVFQRGPGDTDDDEWASTLMALPTVKRLLARSSRSDAICTTNPELISGQVEAFFVGIPVLGDGERTGTVVYQHEAQSFLDSVFVDGISRAFQIELFADDDGVFYRSFDAYSTPQAQVSNQQAAAYAVGRLAFGDQIWGLRGAADSFWTNGKRSTGNALLLWVGLFLAVAIGFAIRKSTQLEVRAASLEAAIQSNTDGAESLHEANASLERQADNLKLTEERLRRSAREKRRVLDSLSAFLVGVDGGGVVTEWNFVSSEVFGLRSSETLGRKFDELNLPWNGQIVQRAIAECMEKAGRVRREDVSVDCGVQEPERVVSYTVNPTQDDAGRGYTIIGADVTERRNLEVQLHHAQKLESVGTLAAGIAHEINTPLQFVSDNVRFLSQSVNPIIGILQLVPGLIEEARKGEPDETLFKMIAEMIEDVDVDFVADEMPMAIEESLEGVERVTTIVRAMKDFSHPGTESTTRSDINEAIETTLAVARNEYKYIAEVKTDFAVLEPVECWVADLNQVFLNLLVNGTHAIRDKIGENSTERGLIEISTRADGGMLEVRFKDSGSGIPEEVQPKIFDQFYTTKEVGRGTGLGLAIARSVVVEKHDGSLTFETEKGVGTTFIIRIPFSQQPSSERHEEHPVC
jgi:PAS domain S-box-containing protein